MLVDPHFHPLNLIEVFVAEFPALTLPPLEAAGFLLHRERPAVAGLTLAPQAFILSVFPTARRILIPSFLMFFAAL